MDLSSGLVWWDEWKLRILVLCSLIVHSSLLFAGYVRRSYVLRSLRVLVWIAYIGGDALAIYALATLFNRQKQQTTADGGSNYAIEVIWAPFLLIHLGGQVQISAYSLEDNELWKRHAITLVSQVAVALYVFFKWWSGETRLLESTVLLFISGILKFSQKPWALRRASYGSMTSNNFSSPPRRAEENFGSRWSWMGRCIKICTTALYKYSYKEELRGKGRGIQYSLEQYVKKAKEHVSAPPTSLQIASRTAQRRNLNYTYSMFLDVSASYSARLDYLQYFVGLEEETQHKMLRKYIDLQFSAIYTKVRSRFTCLGLCTFLVLPTLVVASMVLFAKSDKDAYDKSDIMVTYILFFGTVVIELGSFFIGFSCRRVFRCNFLSQRLTWQDMVAQHNIMLFCARNKKPPALMKLVATFSYLLRDFINKHCYIWYKCKAREISVLVRQHAEYGWKEYIHDPATYKSFNDLRGDNTLKKHQLLNQDMRRTLDRPFDEYVLLWHIATDLCLHHTSSSSAKNTTTVSSCQCRQDTIKSRLSSCEIISNYMIYLLFICPDMLMPAGTRSDMFMAACHEIESMIKNKSPSSSLHKTSSLIAQRMLGMEQGDDRRSTKAPRMISSAHKLAKVLIGLDEEKRWEVIQGVWVEMLCYSASRCRGYLHTKSLGVAPEFLTNVWLLWWCMGMQTLPDMMHNVASFEEEEQTDTPCDMV